MQVGTFQSGQLTRREDGVPQLFETSTVWDGRAGVGSIPLKCSGILERLSDLPQTIVRLSSAECR